MGTNSLGQPFFNIHVTGSVTRKGGGTISTEWNRVRTWTAGYNTLSDISDDVYEITGSGTLTRPNGTMININITKALVVALNCHWIEAGSVSFSLSSGQTKILNYGDTPACDGKATVTLANGTFREIELP